MIKSLFAIVLMAVLIIPASVAECREGMVLSFPENASDGNPAADTVFVYDTIVQYTIIYDTVFYTDTLPHPDEPIPGDTIVKVNDSIDFSSKGLIRGDADISRDTSRFAVKSAGKPDRIMDENLKNSNILPESQRQMSTSSVTIKNKTWRTGQGDYIRNSTTPPFVFYVKDTLYRADTIVIFENLTDTVYYYKLVPRNDTSVSRHTIIEERPNLVVVSKVVNYNIREKSYVIVDQSKHSVLSGYLFWNVLNRDAADNGFPDKNQRQKSQELSRKSQHLNHYKTSGSLSVHRDLDNESGSPGNYYRTPPGKAYFLGGFSLFIPGIDFDAHDQSAGQNAALINENTSGEISYGITVGLKYSRQHFAFESGLGFAQYQYNYSHSKDQMTIDSTDAWDFFLREAYLYDTTWYFDLDKFLETGIWDSIPNVDSTGVWIQDSTLVRDYDTSFTVMHQNYRYSFTFIEIPLIARYPLHNGNVFIDIAAGLIPSFLISKQGNILSDETELVIETEDLAFEYGFNLAFYGALTVGFKMNEKFAILVEPYLKKSIMTGLRNDHIRMKTDAWGIQVAVSYRL